MISSCPNCKKQIEHEDFLFEVLCDCGSRFNPFMLMESATPAAETPESSPEGFKESTNAFQEIRSFGEGEAPPPSVAPTVDPSNPFATAEAPAPRAPRPALAAPLADGVECPVTAADSLPGYQIEASFLPVSAMAELDASGGDPMKNAFQALWQQVSASGGNGCVSLRWQLLPDGGRVIVSGIPVRCTRG